MTEVISTKSLTKDVKAKEAILSNLEKDLANYSAYLFKSKCIIEHMEEISNKIETVKQEIANLKDSAKKEEVE